MEANEDQEGADMQIEDLNALQDEDTEDESFDELMDADHEVLDPDLNLEMEESPTPSDTDEDAQHFDIALAAEHTYMGECFTRVGNAAVVEARQTLRVPAIAASSIVFPGELVPLRLPRTAADRFMQHPDKLLVLVMPDESHSQLSGYGTLCELSEAQLPADGEHTVCLKARATHRVAVRPPHTSRQPPRHLPRPLRFYDTPRMMKVRVLPDVVARCPLHAAATPRALSLLHAAMDAHRGAGSWSGGGSARWRSLQRAAAAGTPWPRFLYDAFSLHRLRNRLRKHFQHQNIAPLPTACGQLSTWACANASLSYSQRLTLLAEDSAIARIALLLRMLAQKSRLLYCKTCGSALANRSDEIAMTTAGVHGHYANPGGVTHDVVTVRHGLGLALVGTPSEEYSWFPGYTWSIVLCGGCREHKGWRFDAIPRRLVPRRFFALVRNHVTPHPPAPHTPSRRDHLLYQEPW